MKRRSSSSASRLDPNAEMARFMRARMVANMSSLGDLPVFMRQEPIHEDCVAA